MVVPRKIQQIMLVCALAAGVAACSSSSNNSGSGATSAPASSPSVSAPASSGGGSAATAQIATNWTTFFNAKTPIAKRVALLQDGQKFASIIKSQAGGGLAASATAKVTKVTVTVTHPGQGHLRHPGRRLARAVQQDRGGRQAGRHLEGRPGQLLRAADPGEHGNSSRSRPPASRQASHVVRSVGVPAERAPAVLRGGRPLALAVLCTVLFLTFLDNTIVSVALGSVQTDLHAGVTAAAVGGQRVRADVRRRHARVRHGRRRVRPQAGHADRRRHLLRRRSVLAASRPRTPTRG